MPNNNLPTLNPNLVFRGLDGKTYRLADCPPIKNGETITVKSDEPVSLMGRPIEFVKGVHESSDTQCYFYPLEPGTTITMPNFENTLQTIASTDVKTLVKKDAEYGSSWKKRGGIGAFMMLARKWDRLETQMTIPTYAPAEPNDKPPAISEYDIFNRIESEREGANSESILETVRDLRRYLLLVESEIVARSCVDKNYGVQPLPAYVNHPQPIISQFNLPPGGSEH
jgi:hypothetical protein